MTVNREWHEQHRMPKFAGRKERAAWHAEHHEVCACRVPNAREQELIDEHRAATAAAPGAHERTGT